MQLAGVRPKDIETLYIGLGHHRQAALRAICQFLDLQQPIKAAMMAALRRSILGYFWSQLL